MSLCWQSIYAEGPYRSSVPNRRAGAICLSPRTLLSLYSRNLWLVSGVRIGLFLFSWSTYLPLPPASHQLLDSCHALSNTHAPSLVRYLSERTQVEWCLLQTTGYASNAIVTNGRKKDRRQGRWIGMLSVHAPFNPNHPLLLCHSDVPFHAVLRLWQFPFT